MYLFCQMGRVFDCPNWLNLNPNYSITRQFNIRVTNKSNNWETQVKSFHLSRIGGSPLQRKVHSSVSSISCSIFFFSFFLKIITSYSVDRIIIITVTQQTPACCQTVFVINTQIGFICFSCILLLLSRRQLFKIMS